MELYKELDNLESQLKKVLELQIPPDVKIESLLDIDIEIRSLLMSVSDWLDDHESLNK